MVAGAVQKICEISSEAEKTGGGARNCRAESWNANVNQSWDERGHEEWGESPGGSEEEGKSSDDSLDLRSATIMRDIWREDSSSSGNESWEFLDERHPRMFSCELEAVPATGGRGNTTGTRRASAEIKPARRIVPMSEERRRKIARGVRGLGFEGRGTVGMSIMYHEVSE